MADETGEPKNPAMMLSEYYRQHLQGPQGESLFHMPLSNVAADTRDVMELIGRMQTYGDARSKALLAALVSEGTINAVLREVMPRYESVLEKDNNCTHSIKIKMLAALNLIPHHLTRAADMVREVRNEFAHNLAIDSLADLPEKITRKLFHYYTERHIDPPEKRNDLDYVFDIVAYGATAGIAAYRVALRDLNEAIRDPAFEQRLSTNAAHRHRLIIQALLEQALNKPKDPDPNPIPFPG